MRIFQKGFNFSQDGPGNRLVYHLQGCNLRCPWCSNPEGLVKTGGTEIAPEELVEEVLRSSLLFFDGGGVTFTGGEATLQFAELKSVLARLHQEGIHTCIETNGLSSRLPELFPVLDLLIMDLKHPDPLRHGVITGLENHQTMENIRRALAFGLQLVIRIPLIGGFNASISDAEAFAARFRELGVPDRAVVELLPYHEYGKDKYETLGLSYTMGPEAKITGQQLAAYEQVLREAGIRLIRT